eukprot:1130453-Pleurochrysis_carterae.AAC.4
MSDIAAASAYSRRNNAMAARLQLLPSVRALQALVTTWARAQCGGLPNGASGASGGKGCFGRAPSGKNTRLEQRSAQNGWIGWRPLLYAVFTAHASALPVLLDAAPGGRPLYYSAGHYTHNHAII